MRRVLLLVALVGCAEPPAPGPEPSAPVVAQAPVPPRPVAPRPARRPAGDQGNLWRVVEDGQTACADPAALRQLRADAEPGAAGLRRLAAARAAGGCVTVFRASQWRLAEQSGDLVRLAPVPAAPNAGMPNGGTANTGTGGLSTPLWFWRDEVAEERAANP